MITIHKLKLYPPFKPITHSGYEALGVAVVNNEPVVFVMVDDESPMVDADFIVVGTGHTVPPNAGKMLGTLVMDANETHPVDLHVFCPEA